MDTESISNILEIIRGANAHLEMDSLRKDVINTIHKAFRSDSSIFWLTDQNGNLINPIAVNLEQRYLAFYQSHFFRYNPFDPINLRPTPKSVITMEDLSPRTHFIQTEYFNDFLKPQKIRRQMALYIRSKDNLIGVIGAHRSKNQCFGERELAIGGIIAPHLASALEKTQLFVRIKKKGDFFRAICDYTSIGVAIFDAKIEPIYLNQKAMEICARIKQEDIDFGKKDLDRFLLPVEFYDDCAELRYHLQDFPRNLRPLFKQRTTAVSSMEKYSIHCQLLDKNLTGIKGPLFLITMKDISEYQRVDKVKLKEEYNLSNREIEIVNHIFKGYKNSEIAETLFICEGTVKNHLKNIFEKMAVKNRTSLIHKALSL